MRGEYALSQEIATAFLREAESASRTFETAAAHRMLGLTHLWQGHFTEAQSHLTAALQIYDQQTEPGRTSAYWSRHTGFSRSLSSSD